MTGRVAAARASFARQTLMQTLGARIERISAGRCDIRCALPDGFSQQHGFAHAAVLMALADTAGGYAAFTRTDRSEDVLTSEVKFNFLEPARGARLSASGRVMRAGRRLIVCDIRAYDVVGRRRICCAVGLQTIVRIRAPNA